MALANLKKCAPSVKRTEVTVDAFIEGAVYYSRGQENVVSLPNGSPFAAESAAALKRATFTLGDVAIEQLNSLSQRTGIAKSRLLRIWLDQVSSDEQLQPFLCSQIK